ncbi:MAG: lysophospholipase [Myxococcaceae bacterium]|nr:lysophospholipase [Myxococcaceae bacterium]
MDEVTFRSLYRKSQYTVETADGWSLVITRYRPVPQAFHQPVYMEPLLVVHGFSQNRHCWTSGEFVKNLLFFGADIHILELRGHGKSSVALQRELARSSGREPPPDLDYGWDLDTYFLYDLPAAVSAVKRVTRRSRIFYCGHSMGGMLGYGYAGIHDDFEGLITIGAACDVGRGFPSLRALALFTPLLMLMADGALGAVNLKRRAWHAGQRLLSAGRARLRRAERGGERGAAAPTFARFDAVPVDSLLKLLERAMARAEDHRLYGRLAERMSWLSNPTRVEREAIRWLLRHGGEPEPRRVIEQFARWIRRNEMVCYRTGYDFKGGFSKLRVPMAIFFGDMDPLATVESTRRVYRSAQSDYLLWRPVKGNSHIELTMGHDIRQVCYDIKNLIEYARSHRLHTPSLPRIR